MRENYSDDSSIQEVGNFLSLTSKACLLGKLQREQGGFLSLFASTDSEIHRFCQRVYPTYFQLLLYFRSYSTCV